MSIQGQGHSLILAQGHSDMNFFFSETTGPFLPNFIKKDKEMKINKYEFGHMTNMAAMPIYGKIVKKNKKNLLLRNQWTDCLETWNVVLGVSRPIVVYSNADWLDLDPIYTKVKFGRICFCMGKVEIVMFLETVVACEL